MVRWDDAPEESVLPVWFSDLGDGLRRQGMPDRPGCPWGFHQQTTQGRASWFLKTTQRLRGGGPVSFTPASHPKAIHSGVCWNGVSPHILMFNRKGREKERKERRRQAGARAECSICFCFPWCSFRGLGSAKPPKAKASSVHFPLCNLPPCLLLTAINHSVMC